MRREQLYLSDMVEAIDDITRFLAGRDEDSFVSDEVLCSAVLQKLIVIGEADSRVSRDLRARHPEVPWTDIVAFRNFAVHAYFAIDWSTVWVAATLNAARLRAQVMAILEAEFGDEINGSQVTARR